MDIDYISQTDLYQDQITQMPIHKELMDKYSQTDIFSGYSVGFAMVLAPNTLPMILMISSSADQFTIVLESGNSYDPNTAGLLKDAGYDIVKHRQTGFDLVVDCGGYFATSHAEGSVEVTRSGIHSYEKQSNDIIVIDSDNSKSKLIETFLGNPKAVIKAIEKYKGTPKVYLQGKKVAVVGYGKIGRGLAREFAKYCPVKVFDVSEKALSVASKYNYETYQINEDKKANSVAIASSNIILTATGIENVMTNYFNKEQIVGSLKLNVGAVDEWGSDYNENDVFKSKHKPFNFNLTPPTPSKYIDPILAAQTEGLQYLANNLGSLTTGIHPLPVSIDKQIVDKFDKIYGGESKVIDRYFLDRHNFSNH